MSYMYWGGSRKGCPYTIINPLFGGTVKIKVTYEGVYRFPQNVLIIIDEIMRHKRYNIKLDDSNIIRKQVQLPCYS